MHASLYGAIFINIDCTKLELQEVQDMIIYFSGTGNSRYIAKRIADFRCLIGRGVTRVEFRLYGFYHYDRVIHYRTDGKHQGKQGQNVDRESGCGQTGECTDQRNDD